MDFAPMSLRMMVPHANDVGEIQHHMNQQAAMQQDFKALQQKKLIERQQSQVRTKDEAEGEKAEESDVDRSFDEILKIFSRGDKF